jgi:hypothetical protein
VGGGNSGCGGRTAECVGQGALLAIQLDRALTSQGIVICYSTRQFRRFGVDNRTCLVPPKLMGIVGRGCRTPPRAVKGIRF